MVKVRDDKRNFHGNWPLGQPIATPRPTLHTFLPEDAAHLHEYLSNIDVYRFEPGEPVDYPKSLLSASIHPKIVQEMLGHSQINLTLDSYSHVLISMLQEASEKMNGLLKI
jgi:integrase